MNFGSLSFALSDMVSAAMRYPLVGMLGWQDIRQRYRRSSLGPFWLTISMGVMIGTMGIVFGQIFKTSVQEFLPFLSIGIILWAFITSVISEGCLSFIAAEGIIKQLPIPLFAHVLRMLWRNILIFCHNFVIFPITLLVMGRHIDSVALLSVLGFILLLLNLTWISLLLGILCTRYRDISQIIGSVLQVLFYLTPIMWMPSSLPSASSFYLLDLNPVFHLIEIVRAPLLGHAPTETNWLVSIGIAIVGWGISIVVYSRYCKRIPYWL